MPVTNLPFVTTVPVVTEDFIDAPQDAHMFCCERGWLLATRTMSREPLYTKTGITGYFRWYEVVAYEAVGLMRIGHG